MSANSFWINWLRVRLILLQLGRGFEPCPVDLPGDSGAMVNRQGDRTSCRVRRLYPRRDREIPRGTAATRKESTGPGEGAFGARAGGFPKHPIQSPGSGPSEGAVARPRKIDRGVPRRACTYLRIRGGNQRQSTRSFLSPHRFRGSRLLSMAGRPRHARIAPRATDQGDHVPPGVSLHRDVRPPTPYCMKAAPAFAVNWDGAVIGIEPLLCKPV